MLPVSRTKHCNKNSKQHETEQDKHLEEPIIERIEKGPVEQVSDSTFGNRHILEVATSEQIGEKVAGVVEQVPLRLGGFVNSGRLASA